MAIETVSSTIVVDDTPEAVSLVDAVTSTDLRLRGLIAGTGVDLTLDTSEGLGKVVVSVPAATNQNVGGGIEVFKSQSGLASEFRTLLAGDGVVLTQQANTIRIDVDTGLIGVNRGSAGAEVFASLSNNEMQFRRLVAGSNVSLSTTADAITINAQTGQNNTGVSLGEANDGGYEIYAGMDGNKLRFKKLFAGPNIRILDNGCGLMIAASLPQSSGGFFDGISIGTGTSIYAGRDDSILKFRSLVGTGGTQISVSGNDIVIDAAGETNTATNVGSGVGLFRNKNMFNLEFRSIVAGDAVSLEVNDDHVVISMDAVLGEPSTGAYSDPLNPGGPGPAFPGWTAQTRIADALDQINKLLGTLLA